MKGAFSISIVFLVFSIVGLSLLPRLSIQLRPSQVSESVHVSYSWSSVSSEVIEKEVTAPLEGALASIQGVKAVNSESYRGGGKISLTFKKGVDIDAARFEVSSLIRSFYKRLPSGVELPQVSYKKGSDEDDPLLMVYSIIGEGTKNSLQNYVEENVVTHIGQLADVSKVFAAGAMPMQWEVAYDSDKMLAVGLGTQDIRNAIGAIKHNRELGAIENIKGQTLFLTYKGQATDSLIWNNIIVRKKEGRVIRLGDVAIVRKLEMSPRSYYRVNGLNTVYLVVYSAKGVNQIDLAKQVQQKIEGLSPSFPDNLSVLVTYDATEKLEKEISKITLRALMAVGILLVFVLLVSRNWSYLLIIFLSLLANLSVSLLLYYLLNVEIHLYSLAGITVSLGIIIDNTIVMVDHLRHFRNKKAFLAVLAATLTTIGSLSVIFFLKEKQRMNLADFAYVMVINLAVSLLVVLWLIPALMSLFPFKSQKIKNAGKIFQKSTKRWLRTNGYVRFVIFSKKWRWAFFVAIIWAFGLPLYLLPSEIIVDPNTGGKESWWNSTYNATLGNDTYVSEVRPWVNKILGGSLYYFNSYMKQSSLIWDDPQTVLIVNVSMPDGATLEQMNDVVLNWENHLAQYEGIEKFISRVWSIDQTSIEIFFTEEAERDGFTYKLNKDLEKKATETGGADFRIYGVGLGFDNALHEGRKNCKIELKGYNFDQLKLFADDIKDSLQKYKRVKDVVIQTGKVWRGKPRYEFVLDMDPELLTANNSSLSNVYNNLAFYSPRDIYAGTHYSSNELLPIFIRKYGGGVASIWNFRNNLLHAQQNFLRLQAVGSIVKERTGTVIRKKNQEYSLIVEYDFLGSSSLSDRVIEGEVDRVMKELPLGYSIKDARRSARLWDKKDESQYWLLLLVVVIIYFICAILLESLVQPFAIIATIPVSFIGVFLTFAVFKLNFDQGGYASMILLCGITVNSALYIINDYNNSLRNYPNRRKISHYMRALNHKLTPILLTILSTILGMIPFLIEGKDGGFWFSLACGAIGGLLFSVIAIFVFLPLFMRLEVLNSSFIHYVKKNG